MTTRIMKLWERLAMPPVVVVLMPFVLVLMYTALVVVAIWVAIRGYYDNESGDE